MGELNTKAIKELGFYIFSSTLNSIALPSWIPSMVTFVYFYSTGKKLVLLVDIIGGWKFCNDNTQYDPSLAFYHIYLNDTDEARLTKICQNLLVNRIIGVWWRQNWLSREHQK